MGCPAGRRSVRKEDRGGYTSNRQDQNDCDGNCDAALRAEHGTMLGPRPYFGLTKRGTVRVGANVSAVPSPTLW